MICECGANVSQRGMAAHLRGRAHNETVARNRAQVEQAVRYRDWMIQHALEDKKGKARYIDGPPLLVAAGATDAGARRALDDYFLDRGVDLLEFIKELDFRIPEGLSPAAVHAAEVIIDVLRKNGDLHAGGGTVFWEPKVWQEHEGDQFEISADLIVTYDGGAHKMYFEPQNREQQFALEAMQKALGKAGCYFEPLSHVYGGIYCHDYDWQQTRNDRIAAWRLPERFRVGQRVRFTRDADHWPHILVPTGTLGTVENVQEDSIDVYPDGFPRDDEWNGCFVFSVDTDHEGGPPFEPI